MMKSWYTNYWNFDETQVLKYKLVTLPKDNKDSQVEFGAEHFSYTNLDKFLFF